MKVSTLVVLRSHDYSLIEVIGKEIKGSPEVIEIPVTGSIMAGEPIPGFTLEQANSLLVALGSAGAFTTFYKILVKVMERNKDKEITLERKGIKFIIKGHSLPEEKAFIQKLFPKSIKSKNIIATRKKLKNKDGAKKKGRAHQINKKKTNKK